MEMYNLNETKKYFIDISNLEARPMSNSIFLEEGEKLSWKKEGGAHVVFSCVKKTRNDVLNQEFYFFVEVK